MRPDLRLPSGAPYERHWKSAWRSCSTEAMDAAGDDRQTPGVELQLYRLLLLNLALQLFDGVATYQGLRLGAREANPILVAAFGLLGVGPTLLLFKAKACGLLVLLHSAAPARVGITVMRALAAIYCVFSLGPWLGKFASMAAGAL
jgi:hypothetical protein